MAFDGARHQWKIAAQHGSLTANFCISATGCLSSPSTPNFKGMDLFRGEIFHTGLWPHEEVDFRGKRVAVVGTGSSAVQSIPIIARQADQLYVFQRTPNYVVPAHNHALDPERQRAVKAEYPALRARAKLNATGIDFDYSERLALETSHQDREDEYETRWRRGGLSFLGAFMDIMMDEVANRTAADFVRARVRQAVRDPKVAELLTPRDTIGCKRLCIDTGYYETFNRPNVTLVDVSRSPVEISHASVSTGERTYEVDAIVFATGFDAMTGALAKIDSRDSHGASLQENWKEGPRTYLGLRTVGFPNLFTITGPGSPSVLTNMLPTIEQHVDWIAEAIGHMRSNNLKRMEPTIDAQDEWVAHGNELAGRTLRYSCGSWYLGANIPGKPRVFMPYIGGLPRYMKKCRQVADNGYEGFVLS
jgi:cyclohexanone monooxygenase